MVASLKFIRFFCVFPLRDEVSPLYLQIYSIHSDSACLPSFPSVRDAGFEPGTTVSSEPTARKDLLAILISIVQ